MKPLLWLSLAALLAVNARACIWDADSLWHEKLRSHDLAAAILGEPPADEDTQKLKSRIQDLEAHRNETSAEWWNNLAGAYLRLNQPAQAAKILEPVREKFPNDYGLHANLGTAYHLLGRYAEAEKEIARDLEINPDAHFGLEKYHLALLQYLLRDAKYQSRHVYVDEFSASFFFHGGGRFYFQGDDSFSTVDTNDIASLEEVFSNLAQSTNSEREATDFLGHIAMSDAKPGYRANWNLAKDTNFVAGIIYMAQMNPKEPACFEMLGLAAWKQRNYHLAVSALEKALALGSPQTYLLPLKIAELKNYIRESRIQSMPIYLGAFVMCLVPIIIALYIYTKIRDYRRKRAAAK